MKALWSKIWKNCFFLCTFLSVSALWMKTNFCFCKTSSNSLFHSSEKKRAALPAATVSRACKQTKERKIFTNVLSHVQIIQNDTAKWNTKRMMMAGWLDGWKRENCNSFILDNNTCYGNEIRKRNVWSFEWEETKLGSEDCMASTTSLQHEAC